VADEESLADKVQAIKARRAESDAASVTDAAARAEEIAERSRVQRERFQTLVETRQTEARIHQNRRRGRGQGGG
jgi:hypothetical protein